MALYSTDQVLGQGTTTFVDDLDVFVEAVGGTAAPAASSTSLTVSNLISMDSNAGSLTGNNCTLVCETFRNAAVGSSSPVNLTNTRVHLNVDTGNAGDTWFFPTTWTNVDLFHELTAAEANYTVGIYGNGSGTNFPTFDADGHIATAGDGHRARARPWVWNNVRIFGNGSLRFTINGVVPETSVFNNVDFYPDAVNNRGAFGELPYVPFADANWGPFYRTDFPGITNAWARQTGGMRRAEYDVEDNWIIQPQWNVTGIGTDTARYVLDANVWAICPNMILPANNNLGFQGLNVSTTSPARGTQVLAWNPNVNPDITTGRDIKYVFTGFNILDVPATYTGGNTDGTAVVPAAFTSGTVEPAGFNGLFLVEVDANLTAGGTEVGIEAYEDRDINIFSYNTQVDTLSGSTITRQFGEPTTVGFAQRNEINADLTWRTTSDFEFTVDPYLFGRTEAQGVAGTSLTETDHIYPTLKAVAYRNESRDQLRLPVIPGPNSIRFLRGVVFNTSLTSITSSSGAVGINLQSTGVTATNINTFDFRNESDANQTVQWTSTNRTFTSPLTINGGTHSNFPSVWSNTLMFGASASIDSGTINTTLDWSNVSFADGVTVNFTGNTPISIGGVPMSERSHIMSDNNIITFVDAPVTNTVNIDTTVGGYYAVRRNNGGVNTEFPGRGLTRFTAGSTVPPINFASDVFAAGDSLDVYIKYDSDISTRTVYQEQVINVPFDTTMNAVTTITQPAPVATTLIENMVTALPSSLTGNGITSNFENSMATIVITNQDAQTSLILTNFTGQTLAVVIANQPDYFESWYNNRGTSIEPIVTFLQGETENWDNRRVFFQSGNVSGGNRQQHIVRNWTDTGGGTFADSRSGAPEVLPSVEGQASIGTVIAAVESSTSVAQIRRGVGYTVDSVFVNAPNSNGPYSNTGNYGDDL